MAIFGRRRLFWAGAAALAAAAYAQYPVEEDTDREYGLDLLQLSYDRDWDLLWTSYDRGVRFAMGSLNVRQWYFEPEVKFAADFTSRLRFTYDYYRREGLEPLENERDRNDFGLEGRAWRGLWGGLYINPTFWKRESDAGLTVRWRPGGPARWVMFRYDALDFDNNYSFERSDIDEGYEEIFHVPPRRWRLASVWDFPFGLRAEGDAALRQPSIKYYTYFEGQQPNRARRFAERWAHVKLSQKLTPTVELYYAGGYDAWHETVRYPDGGGFAAEDDEYDARLSLSSHLAGAYYQPPGRHRWRSGFGYRGQKRRWRFADAAAFSHDYDKRELLYFALWRSRLWRELYLETGYAGERVKAGYLNLANGYYDGREYYENRVPVSLEYKFTDRYAFKMASGIDLDGRDWAAYLFYDKAYVFVIACF